MNQQRSADARNRRGDREHVPTTVDDWVLPRLPYRSVAGDVVTSALVAVVGTVAIVTRFGASIDAYVDGTAVPIAATLGAAVALLAKRRRPVLTVMLVATMVALSLFHAGDINIGLGYAALDALYAAALLGGRAQRRVVMAMCLAVATAATLGVAGTIAERLESGLTAVLVLGAPLFLGTASRQRDALIRSERARREAESARVDAVARAAIADRQRAVQAERATLARDLHDGVAAHLSAIALQAGAAAAEPDADPTMGAVRSSSLAALAELRQLIEVLHAEGAGGETHLRVPPGLEETAILEADARHLGVSLHLDIELPADALSRVTSHVLMRIAREAVTNAARHAPGAPLHLDVRPDGDVVVLRATNPLAASDAADHLPAGGLGTVIMLEQAAAVGGRCTAGPDGDHWVVRAAVPRQRQAVDA